MKRILLLLAAIVLLNACSSNGDKASRPSASFIAFTKELKNQGLTADPERLRKKGLYRELKPELATDFGGQPFYPIEPKNSKLYQIASAKQGSAVDRVSSIWAYFYRETDAIVMVPDGVIEQWAFPDEETADKVLHQFIDLKDAAFFNTVPYYCREKKNVYVFHSRAALYSDQQKDVFEKFIRKTDAYVEN